MVTEFLHLINNINEMLITVTVQRLIVLCRFFFSLFFGCMLDVMWLFSKAQNRGQGRGDALSGSSENQNIETL